MPTIFTLRRSYAFLLLATVTSVALADFFFYDHRIGWTVAAFTAIFLALFAFRDARFLRTLTGKIIALATIGLLLALIEQPTWLNVPYTILCLGALAIVNTFGPPRDVPQWVKRLTRLLATGWMRLFADNSIVIRFLARHGINPNAARGILAWLVPVLLTSVFVAIFAWANPIVADWLSHLGDWINRLIQLLPDFLNLARALFWLGFAIFAWTLMRARGRRSRKTRALPPPILSDAHRYELDPGFQIAPALAIRCLLLFNLVFAVENLLDVRYLTDPNSLPATMTYKEYVHRGAYPLIAAALLAGAFVLGTFRPNTATERSPWARRLVYLWIGQTIFLTLSAAWRLERYVGMSELTRWRVASVIWFALVATGLFYIIWRILTSRSNRWLLNINAVTAIAVLYFCCFINFDGMIANFNIRHCREGGGPGSSLDIEYFRDLGPTSLAALDTIRPKIDLDWRHKQAADVSADLHQELRDEMGDWRSWTLRRMRAQRAVEEQTRYAREKQQLAAAP